MPDDQQQPQPAPDPQTQRLEQLAVSDPPAYVDEVFARNLKVSRDLASALELDADEMEACISVANVLMGQLGMYIARAGMATKRDAAAAFVLSAAARMVTIISDLNRRFGHAQTSQLMSDRAARQIVEVTGVGEERHGRPM